MGVEMKQHSIHVDAFDCRDWCVEVASKEFR